MECPAVQIPTIPRTEKDDTMAGMHRSLKREEFKTQLEVGDAVDDLVRSAFWEIFEER